MTASHILRLEILGFLCALAATVVYRILTRRIEIDGLLSEDNASGNSQIVSNGGPDDVQQLMTKLGVKSTSVTYTAPTQPAAAK